mgnify:CR=1 FL=1
MEIFPGDDQRVRLADSEVKKNSTIIRPISKLVLLAEETQHLFTVKSSLSHRSSKHLKQRIYISSQDV